MSQIGVTAAGAASTFDLSYLPQFLQIGTVQNASTFSQFTVIARGQTLIQLSSVGDFQTLLLLEGVGLFDPANPSLPQQLLLASGRIEGQSTITLNQVSLNADNVYQHSTGLSTDSLARRVAVTPVISSGNNTFTDFDVIYFLPTNVDRVQVTYDNGFTEDLAVDEVNAYYAANNPANALGQVNGYCVIDGYRAQEGFRVNQATIFANGGGNVNVIVCGWTAI